MADTIDRGKDEQGLGDDRRRPPCRRTRCTQLLRVVLRSRGRRRRGERRTSGHASRSVRARCGRDGPADARRHGRDRGHAPGSQPLAAHAGGGAHRLDRRSAAAGRAAGRRHRLRAEGRRSGGAAGSGAGRGPRPVRDRSRGGRDGAPGPRRSSRARWRADRPRAGRPPPAGSWRHQAASSRSTTSTCREARSRRLSVRALVSE